MSSSDGWETELEDFLQEYPYYEESLGVLSKSEIYRYRVLKHLRGIDQQLKDITKRLETRIEELRPGEVARIRAHQEGESDEPS